MKQRDIVFYNIINIFFLSYIHNNKDWNSTVVIFYSVTLFFLSYIHNNKDWNRTVSIVSGFIFYPFWAISTITRIETGHPQWASNWIHYFLSYIHNNKDWNNFVSCIQCMRSNFLSYIHNNKDWNFAAKAINSSPLVLFELYPQ